MLSNEELGRRIGVTHSHASRVRNGRRLPGARVVREISRELGIPLGELMEAHSSGAPAFGRLVSEALDGQRAGAAA